MLASIIRGMKLEIEDWAVAVVAVAVSLAFLAMMARAQVRTEVKEQGRR